MGKPLNDKNPKSISNSSLKRDDLSSSIWEFWDECFFNNFLNPSRLEQISNPSTSVPRIFPHRPNSQKITFQGYCPNFFFFCPELLWGFSELYSSCQKCSRLPCACPEPLSAAWDFCLLPEVAGRLPVSLFFFPRVHGCCPDLLPRAWKSFPATRAQIRASQNLLRLPEL